jgi:hypothetical protein
MRNKITLIGFEKVKKDYYSFLTSGDITKNTYLNFIGNAAISLLEQNTPKDTGELSKSWKILGKDSNSVTIGVDDSQEDALQAVIFGTSPSAGRFVPALGVRLISKNRDIGMHPGTIKNDFVLRVQSQLNGLMGEIMKQSMLKGHKFYRGFDSPSDRANLSKIVGLTGLKGHKRRGLGRTSFNIRTGRKSFRVRIGRRRRVMSTNYIKRVELG